MRPRTLCCRAPSPASAPAAQTPLLCIRHAPEPLPHPTAADSVRHTCRWARTSTRREQMCIEYAGVRAPLCRSTPPLTSSMALWCFAEASASGGGRGNGSAATASKGDGNLSSSAAATVVSAAASVRPPGVFATCGDLCVSGRQNGGLQNHSYEYSSSRPVALPASCLRRQWNIPAASVKLRAGCYCTSTSHQWAATAVIVAV